jgi:asparagine synthase (glutamine-hydrolysing)
MIEALRHRGPDGSGLFLSGVGFKDPVSKDTSAARAALGSTRLSIIDLSPAGRQPMANEDERIWVVCNGEIYNFRSLREDLERRGHRFRSQTDTEIIVHAYEEWGAECVRHFRGMFALAIVDDRHPGRPSLFLARDRFGIKPLYYARRGETILCASEVRALLASGLVRPRLSSTALTGYLLWGSVVEPATLVDDVHSLPPAHWMRVSANGGSPDIHTEAYWDLGATQAQNGHHADRAVMIKRLRGVLEESVRLHLVADVPVGVFLSGGIDSNAIAALAARMQRNLHTVTVGLPESPRSEAIEARRAAHRLGASHYEVVLTGNDIVPRLDQAVRALDQPSMDGINSYFVSWGARQAGLKVALSGLGGDELFGGYPSFAWVPRLERLAAIAGRTPESVRHTAGAAIRVAGAPLGRDAARKLADLCEHPDALPHPYAFMRGLFPPTHAARLLNGQAPTLGMWPGPLPAVVARMRASGPFARVSVFELSTYLVNTLLRDTDAMSMAHSLEVRVPLLDHVLVELAGHVPDRWKTQKRLLVEALGADLPTNVARQRKRTFTLPWDVWLRGPLERKVRESLSEVPESLRPFVDANEAKAVWRAFTDRQTGWARPWTLHVLYEWVRTHLTRTRQVASMARS